MQSTEAWIIYAGPEASSPPEPAELKKEIYSFSDLDESEVLIEPLYGSWEANMAHAVARRPIDVCRARGEPKVVIGNSTVVRVLKPGTAVKSVREGDVCIVYGNADADSCGYMLKAMGYDAPNVMGMLAKQTKVPETWLIPIPRNTRYSYQQWAMFPVRYVSAWSNWKVAYGCWRVQMSEEDMPAPFVWGWGGGTTLAEVTLAQRHGCRAAMMSSKDSRLKLLERLSVTPVDRRRFVNLSYDEKKYASDRAYRQGYLEAEETFLQIVKEITNELGVAIFLDYIGPPVTRATLKALARQGVLATAGWKHGMVTSSVRSIECISRHTFVHTHYARRSEAVAAVHYGENTGWMPPISADDKIYAWDDIPDLARDYASGQIDSYFPVYAVNPA